MSVSGANSTYTVSPPGSSRNFMSIRSSAHVSCAMLEPRTNRGDEVEPVTFGQRLARARKRTGMSQRDLAKALGVSHGAVGNWESDLATPDPDTIAQIAV